MAIDGTGDVRGAHGDERFEASWLIVIAIPGRDPIQVSARDVSRTSASLAVPASIELPETFAFRIVGKSFVVRARKVWRRGNYVGVAIERTAPLPVPFVGSGGGRPHGPERRGNGSTPVEGVTDRRKVG